MLRLCGRQLPEALSPAQLSGNLPPDFAVAGAENVGSFWCILPRDVRTFSFCQLTGFPLNHQKLLFIFSRGAESNRVHSSDRNPKFRPSPRKEGGNIFSPHIRLPCLPYSQSGKWTWGCFQMVFHLVRKTCHFVKKPWWLPAIPLAF